ncbi:MAG: rhodanese-like domain-containing protein [Bacteroidetes bacterium]|nr:rhodanese-like domain-containing protein [Bacteroidota bacterium]MBM3425219.1 rhodanese-like domain-containing protein [Bacteroidota bacterium]
MSEFNGTIVDVRTRAEFNSGHVAQSVNIPLQEIMEHLEEIKRMKSPIILCCAAGIRSEQATQYLRSRGVACENGGSWLEVNDRFAP